MGYFFTISELRVRNKHQPDLNSITHEKICIPPALDFSLSLGLFQHKNRIDRHEHHGY